MDKEISAADANRRFSELLRTVKKGRSVIVTSHGKPVAKSHRSSRTSGWQRERAPLCSRDYAENGLLLSEDLQDGFTWHGVTVTNPFAPTPHPLLAGLLTEAEE